MPLLPNTAGHVGFSASRSELQKLSEATSFSFFVRNIDSLSTEPGDYIESQKFLYGNGFWKVLLFPGGFDDDHSRSISLVLALCSRGVKKTLQIDFHLLDTNGVCALGSRYVRTFNSSVKTSIQVGGTKSFSRSFILDPSNNLVHQNSTMRLRVSLKELDGNHYYEPGNNFANNLFKCYFLNDESADGYFEVGSSDGNTSTDDDGVKRSKTTTRFPVHRFMLKPNAPMLNKLFQTDDHNQMIATAHITDIKPDVFRILLMYVYGGDVPDEQLKTHAKDIIDAADKYEIVNLKIAAEVAYVKSTPITLLNVYENLLYAHSKNCALLKEAVMEYIAENRLITKIGPTLFGTFSPKSIMDIWAESNCFAEEKLYEQDLTDHNLMRVCELRSELDRRGLDADYGSRKELIKAIESYQKRSKTL